ncbi:MAG: hypothetical protein J7483_10955 [Novosphingobium sp.]|nr:hypothetical protein [Novosphingobium sp.]
MIANKLVESWLDNQTERQYQPAFIQLLISEGWTVLHNTRHSPLEFGKDVIARDPNGALYAIQLKGNPGSRLTKSQAQEMLPQVHEGLVSFVPDAYRRESNEKHKFVICTNGEIDEEALVLFQSVAKICDSGMAAASSVEYWARGALLQRFSQKIEDIWPSNVKAMAATLRLYTHDGLDTPSPREIAIPIFASLTHTGKLTSSRKNSLITSSFLMAEIVKAPWYRTDDHYSLYLITVIATVACGPLADSKDRQEIVSEYATVALNHCTSLIEEAQDAGFVPGEIWARGNPMAEFDIMQERQRRIADCAAVIVLADALMSDTSKAYIRDLIRKSFGANSLWGQAVIPSMILRYWALRRLEAGIGPDQLLVTICRSCISAASMRRAEQSGANAAPYYSFEEVLYQVTGGEVGIESSIAQDRASGRSYFAKPLFLMTAKRNWKQSCKALWRRYSNLLLEEVNVPGPEFCSPAMSEKGENITEQNYSANWNDLLNMAIDLGRWSFGERFKATPWLLAAYISCVPYRASPRVILHLDERLSKTWYSATHRPGDPILR